MIGPRMAVLMLLPALVGLMSALAVRRWRADVARDFAIRGLPLVAVGVLAEVLRHLVLPDDASRAVAAGRSFALLDLAIVAALVYLNRAAVSIASRLVVRLVGLGVACNATAVLVAGAMPYSATAARTAGLPADEVDGHLMGYVHSDTVPRVAALLGDIWPVPPLMKVLSIGDVLMFVGLGIGVALVFARSLLGEGPRRVTDVAPAPTTERR